MRAMSHAKRYRNARASTLACLIVQDQTTAKLEAEVESFVAGVLLAELEQALADMPREQRARIEETY